MKIGWVFIDINLYFFWNFSVIVLIFLIKFELKYNGFDTKWVGFEIKWV
jgi:hypothetical protein